MKKQERIVWVDSYVPDDVGWQSIADATKGMGKGGVVITTIGHVIKRKGGWLAIAGSRHDNRVCSVIFVPECCVVSREAL